MINENDYYMENIEARSSPYLLNMLQNKPHAERKRLLVGVYSKSNILNSRELATISRSIIAERVYPRIQDWATNHIRVNVLDETKACFMDMITAYLFGSDNGTNFVLDHCTRDYYFQAFRHRSSGFFWRTEFPGLSVGLRHIGNIFNLKKASESKTIVEEWCTRPCETAHKSSSESNPDRGGNLHSSVYARLRYGLESQKVSGDLLERSVAAEMLDHIIASYDASGITLTFLMYEVSKHPKMQHELRKELRGLSRKSSSSMYGIQLDSLPLLDAILIETLRLYSVSPGPKPRSLPPEGADVGGFKITGSGITVSASSYSLHRDTAIFPAPEEWRPERWLSANAETKTEMTRWFWAFGSGTRACIGRHYAIHSTSKPWSEPM